MTARINLGGLERVRLEKMFADMDERSFRAQQILQWIHQRGVVDFAAMTDLAKGLRGRLDANCEIVFPKILRTQESTDATVKFLLQLADGNCIETVFIPEATRATLCVSSQVGCALNCSFCATARQGFNRNLTADEIIGQVWVVNDFLRGVGKKITNVVLMGMGEPLLNFENVVGAMRLLTDDYAYGLSRRRVTLSTAGMVPAILKLSKECAVSLAVSLHAPDDALRDELVPLNKKYPIAELLYACREYSSRNKLMVTFEYVMLDGINDSTAHAKTLAKKLGNLAAKVNLIPFNPSPGIFYKRSSQNTIDKFRQILLDKDIVTVTRKTRGDDIDAACGQLAGRVIDRTRRSQRLAALAA